MTRCMTLGKLVVCTVCIMIILSYSLKSENIWTWNIEVGIKWNKYV